MRSPFRWMVPTSGYHWLLEEGTASSVTQPSVAEGENDEDRQALLSLEPVVYEFRTYEPFEYPGLFRTFAALDQTEEAILGFANKYGHLGDDAEFPEELSSPRQLRTNEAPDAALDCLTEREKSLFTRDWLREQRFYYSLPEPMPRWTRAIESMRRCVEKWDQFRGGAVDRSVVDNLLEETNEQLVFEVELMLRPNERFPNVLELEHIPRHLLAALWIQMAQAVAENKSLRKCPGCDQWFEWSEKWSSPESSSKQCRKSRRYCTGACKSQAYRNRKTKAMKMAEAGRGPAEIAECLKTKIAIVEGWLRQK